MSLEMSDNVGIPYATELTDTTPKNVPIWNPNGLYKEWGMHEIFFGIDKIGPGNTGRFVGNIGDKVFSPETGTWIIDQLDPTTLIPTMRKYQEPISAGGTAKDFLLGVGSRYPEPGFFLYVDNDQKVPRVCIDGQAYFSHPAVKYFRLYAGTQVVGNVETISAWFDASGTYIGDTVPRVKIPAEASPDGRAFFVCEEFWATRKLIPGEPVALVAFSQENSIVGQVNLVVREGSYVRRGSAPVRQIASVKLVCPYLSPQDTENRIRIPTGTNIQSVVMSCRITLNTGEPIDLPIDGDKVRLQGMDEMVAMSPGFQNDLILYYRLGEGEVYVGSQNNDGSQMTVRYTVEVDPTQDTYGFKLFAFPNWINEVEGYDLVVFMHDYDHSQVYDVTGLVELTSNSSEWDPLLYGKKQYLRLAIDVSKVDQRYSSYRHVQPIQITLFESGIASAENYWRVYFENGQSPSYGDGCVAKFTYVSSQVWTLNATAGATTYEQWLDKLYYRTLPLFDPQVEEKPMEPTHFVIVVEGQRYRRPVSDWNASIQTKTAGDEGEAMVIHWVHNDGQHDLWLGTSGLLIRQIIPG